MEEYSCFDEEPNEMGEDSEYAEDEYGDTSFIIQREVKNPMHVKIEAQVRSSGTFIKFWHVSRGADNFHWCFVETIDPEPLVNAIEQRLNDGMFFPIVQFIKESGRTIRDPVEIRLKMDSALGISGVTLYDSDEPFEF